MYNFIFFPYIILEQNNKMPSKALKTRTTKSSTKSSSGSSSGRAAGTAATPRATGRAATGRAATGRAATGRAATGRAATGKAVSQRAATGRAATGRAASPRAATGRAASPGAATSPRAAAAFAAAVAAKDTNRLHNLPVDVQTYIMKLAKIRKKNSRGKYELYKKIYYDRQKFMDWLDEIKRDGVDDKNRVRNPLREGSMIYTDKNGLYSKLWHLCMQIFQGSYDRRGVPEPVKRYYKKAQLKFFNKPPQPQPAPPQPSI
jgi:hypothetical protein